MPGSALGFTLRRASFAMLQRVEGMRQVSVGNPFHYECPMDTICQPVWVALGYATLVGQPLPPT